MKTSFLTLLLFMLSPLSVFSQTEKIESKTAMDNFAANYNAGNFDAIFLNFSPEMQKSVPIVETKAFLSAITEKMGKIVEVKFSKYEGACALYKTTFERALCAIRISVDDKFKVNMLLIKPFGENDQPKPDRNRTKLILPFNEEWTVVWGGDTRELNYHIENVAQKNAFDFVIKNEKGLSFKTDGKKNEDYYAFGKNLIAPCDGEVVLVVDGIKDNVPGVFNPVYVPGNTVIIKTANNEYLFFAHFKKHSIFVKEGQYVKQGQVLGLCGNSGNSSEPHLHFHIQNIEDMNFATSIKCYFTKIQTNGEVKMDYSPIQKDKISNEK